MAVALTGDLNHQGPERASTVERSLLAVVLSAALAARVWFLSSGVPHAVGVDEPAIVDRALRILHTGDWNPHIFDYPTLVIYLNALVAIVRFLFGAITGEWTSLAGFDIAAVYQAARLVAALIGVATVWLTYRIGSEIDSPRLGLLAAAQLAVLPMHVRESHFALTDGPVTALTTLTLWLVLRARRVHTIGAYTVAGVAAGLAGAAKYNGGIVFVAVAAALVLHERSSRDRFTKIVWTLVGTLLAFLVAVPYSWLDLPDFLNGFAAQAARFSLRRATEDPAWVLYLKHFSLAGRFWLPAAAAGTLIAIARSDARRRWLPVLMFVGVYFYVLATHPLVFARYALPLAPVICVLAAVPVSELVRQVPRIPWLTGRYAVPAVVGCGALALTVPFMVQTIDWLEHFKAHDTRQTATDWLMANAARGTRIALEESGPSYLAAAGFDVTPTETLDDHPMEWYVARGVRYLVVSSGNPARAERFRDLGPIVFQLMPSANRWGPPISIVQVVR